MRKEKITRITSIRFTSCLRKYLGFQLFHGRFQLFHGRPKKEDFNESIERVTRKLAAWRGRLLNKPDKLMLTNAVLLTLRSYRIQIQCYPQFVCEALDRTARQFIWKGSLDKGIHVVWWTAITQSWKFGGLGVRVSRIQNIVLLGKLVWDLLQGSNKLCVEVFAAKYIGSGTFKQQPRRDLLLEIQ